MIPNSWTEVSSSTISRVKFEQHDYDNNGDLLVEFRSGKIYKYDNVPAQYAERLVHSSSPGSYHRSYIAGSFNAERVS